MEGEGLKKKRFNRDFKISVVKMVTQEGHKASNYADNTATKELEFKKDKGR